MNLAQMSVSGAVMILVTVVFRSLFIHHLPKRTFLFMWSVVMVRLLIPFSLPCIFSAYSIFTRKAVADEIPQNVTETPLPDFFTESLADLPAAPANPPSAVQPLDPVVHPAIDPRTAVWLTGVLLCFVFFAVSYVKCRMKFRESLPVDNEFINRWLAENKLFRRISVRSSDRISTPLTYGVFRPVILLPKNYRQLGNDDLKFVLTHEYVHIRRFDAVFKLALIAALCVHWFNPMVWVMFIIANRDIEISCDEAVIRMLGEYEKQTYAMTLISMEERKSGLAAFNNSFSRSAIKERIIAIMKFKKATVLTVIASACLVVGTTTVFATSAQTQNNDIPDEPTSIAGESNDTSLTGSTVDSEPEPTSSAENSESEPVESSAEPVEEKTVSVEDWLKQPHSSPLANVNVELDPAGKYTFTPAEPETEVYAIDDGEVVFAKVGFSGGSGATVVIKHTDDIYTVYSHLNIARGFEVGEGDNVKAGQCIGYVGISGNADRYGLGFFCINEMPNFENSRGLLYNKPVEDWLKQPHCSPLANVSVELDPTGGYTFIPAEPETEVYAMDNGEVVFAGIDNNHGNGAVVVVKYAEKVYTFYSHLNLDREFEVSVGDNVKAGQCIGYVGNSGMTDLYGLGVYCKHYLPDLGYSAAHSEGVLADDYFDYDYIIPVEGGFITGRYN